MSVVLMCLLEWDTLSCSSTSIIPRFIPVHSLYSTYRFRQQIVESTSRSEWRADEYETSLQNFILHIASHTPILLCRTPVPAPASPLPSISSLDPPTASISHHCITIGQSRYPRTSSASSAVYKPTQAVVKHIIKTFSRNRCCYGIHTVLPARGKIGPNHRILLELRSLSLLVIELYCTINESKTVF